MVNGREERICFGPTLSSALDNHPDGTQEDGEPLERGRKRKERWHSTLGELRLAFAGGAPSRLLARCVSVVGSSRAGR